MTAVIAAGCTQRVDQCTLVARTRPSSMCYTYQKWKCLCAVLILLPIRGQVRAKRNVQMCTHLNAVHFTVYSIHHSLHRAHAHANTLCNCTVEYIRLVCSEMVMQLACKARSRHRHTHHTPPQRRVLALAQEIDALENGSE